jgi:hypothetical protein
MKKFILSLSMIFTFGFCMPGSALAQQCIPLNEVLSNAELVSPVKQYVVLDIEQTVRLVAWFNKIPPETTEKFDYAVLIFHVDGNVGMLLGNGGFCKGGIIVPEQVQDMMNAISGDHP